GVVGFQSHAACSLQTRRHIDPVTFFQGHDRTLDFRLLSYHSFDGLDLAFADVGVDAFDLDVEELLDRFLDLWFGRVFGNLEHHLVVLRGDRCLLGDHRRKNEVVMARIARTHFSRASSACNAVLVNTRTCRRRISYTLIPWTGST